MLSIAVGAILQHYSSLKREQFHVDEDITTRIDDIIRVVNSHAEFQTGLQKEIDRAKLDIVVIKQEIEEFHEEEFDPNKTMELPIIKEDDYDDDWDEGI
jgi:hypothetical protein